MMKNDIENIENPIGAVYDKRSRILILGTMPSPESRRRGFFYSHPSNRFWRALAEILEADVPQTNEEKREFVLENGIALWDVLKSCDIVGASDSSIRNAVPNDIPRLLESRDRRLTGPTVPPDGLYLSRIWYDGDVGEMMSR